MSVILTRIPASWSMYVNWQLGAVAWGLNPATNPKFAFPPAMSMKPPPVTKSFGLGSARPHRMSLCAWETMHGRDRRLALGDFVESHRDGNEDVCSRERSVDLDDRRVDRPAAGRQIAGVRKRCVEEGRVDEHSRSPPAKLGFRFPRRCDEHRGDKPCADRDDREQRGAGPRRGGIHGRHGL